MTRHTIQLAVDGGDPIDLRLARWPGDSAGAFVVLHGGAGPQSVAPFCALLAEHTGTEVIAPTHPGFGGTARPAALTSTAALADLYARLLDELDLHHVTVLGNSFGGWLGAELALRRPESVIYLILIDAVGIEVPGHPVADPKTVGVPEIVARSFHEPSAFQVDPRSLSAEARAVQTQNMESLAAYSEPDGHDAGLAARLGGLRVPTLVLWGESDRIVDLAYTQAWASAIPDARLHVLARTGHVPQLETPHHVLTVALDFVTETAPAVLTDATWSAEYVAHTDLAPAAVWASLRDLYTGRPLSERSDQIDIHGPFRAGTSLSVHPQGTDITVACEIVDLVEPERYAYASVLGGLRLLSRHTLRAGADGTLVAHYQEITGPTAAEAGPDLGARITDDTAEAMADLLAAAGAR